MEQAILNEFKQFFTQQKESLLQKMEETPSVVDLSGGDELDQVMSERDQELELKLRGRDMFYLKKIDYALKKIHQGGYGHCEECDQDISVARLKARPCATLCLKCKEENEKVEGQVLYHRRSHTLGKRLVNQQELKQTVDDNQKAINFLSFINQDKKRKVYESA